MSMSTTPKQAMLILALLAVSGAVKLDRVQRETQRVNLTQEVRVSAAILRSAASKTSELSSLEDSTSVLESTELQRLRAFINRWNSLELKLAPLISTESNKMVKLFDDAVSNAASARALLGHFYWKIGRSEDAMRELQQACPVLWRHKKSWRSFDKDGWFDCYKSLSDLFTLAGHRDEAQLVQQHFTKSFPWMHSVLLSESEVSFFLSRNDTGKEELDRRVMSIFLGLSAQNREKIAEEVKGAWALSEGLRSSFLMLVEDFLLADSNRLRVSILLRAQSVTEEILEQYLNNTLEATPSSSPLLPGDSDADAGADTTTTTTPASSLTSEIISAEKDAERGTERESLSTTTSTTNPPIPYTATVTETETATVLLTAAADTSSSSLSNPAVNLPALRKCLYEEVQREISAFLFLMTGVVDHGDSFIYDTRRRFPVFSVAAAQAVDAAIEAKLVLSPSSTSSSGSESADYLGERTAGGLTTAATKHEETKEKESTSSAATTATAALPAASAAGGGDAASATSSSTIPMEIKNDILLEEDASSPLYHHRQQQQQEQQQKKKAIPLGRDVGADLAFWSDDAVLRAFEELAEDLDLDLLEPYVHSFDPSHYLLGTNAQQGESEDRIRDRQDRTYLNSRRTRAHQQQEQQQQRRRGLTAAGQGMALPSEGEEARGEAAGGGRASKLREGHDWTSDLLSPPSSSSSLSASSAALKRSRGRREGSSRSSSRSADESSSYTVNGRTERGKKANISKDDKTEYSDRSAFAQYARSKNHKKGKKSDSAAKSSHFSRAGHGTGDAAEQWADEKERRERQGTRSSYYVWNDWNVWSVLNCSLWALAVAAALSAWLGHLIRRARQAASKSKTKKSVSSKVYLKPAQLHHQQQQPQQHSLHENAIVSEFMTHSSLSVAEWRESALNYTRTFLGNIQIFVHEVRIHVVTLLQICLQIGTALYKFARQLLVRLSGNVYNRLSPEMKSRLAKIATVSTAWLQRATKHIGLECDIRFIVPVDSMVFVESEESVGSGSLSAVVGKTKSGSKKAKSSSVTGKNRTQNGGSDKVGSNSSVKISSSKSSVDVVVVNVDTASGIAAGRDGAMTKKESSPSSPSLLLSAHSEPQPADAQSLLSSDMSSRSAEQDKTAELEMAMGNVLDGSAANMPVSTVSDAAAKNTGTVTITATSTAADAAADAVATVPGAPSYDTSATPVSSVVGVSSGVCSDGPLFSTVVAKKQKKKSNNNKDGKVKEGKEAELGVLEVQTDTLRDGMKKDEESDSAAADASAAAGHQQQQHGEDERGGYTEEKVGERERLPDDEGVGRVTSLSIGSSNGVISDGDYLPGDFDPEFGIDNGESGEIGVDENDDNEGWISTISHKQRLRIAHANAHAHAVAAAKSIAHVRACVSNGAGAGGSGGGGVNGHKMRNRHRTVENSNQQSTTSSSSRPHASGAVAAGAGTGAHSSHSHSSTGSAVAVVKRTTDKTSLSENQQLQKGEQLPHTSSIDGRTHTFAVPNTAGASEPVSIAAPAVSSTLAFSLSKASDATITAAAAGGGGVVPVQTATVSQAALLRSLCPSPTFEQQKQVVTSNANANKSTQKLINALRKGQAPPSPTRPPNSTTTGLENQHQLQEPKQQKSPVRTVDRSLSSSSSSSHNSGQGMGAGKGIGRKYANTSERKGSSGGGAAAARVRSRTTGGPSLRGSKGVAADPTGEYEHENACRSRGVPPLDRHPSATSTETTSASAFEEDAVFDACVAEERGGTGPPVGVESRGGAEGGDIRDGDRDGEQSSISDVSEESRRQGQGGGGGSFSLPSPYPTGVVVAPAAAPIPADTVHHYHYYHHHLSPHPQLLNYPSPAGYPAPAVASIVPVPSSTPSLISTSPPLGAGNTPAIDLRSKALASTAAAVVVYAPENNNSNSAINQNGIPSPTGVRPFLSPATTLSMSMSLSPSQPNPSTHLQAFSNDEDLYSSFLPSAALSQSYALTNNLHQQQYYNSQQPTAAVDASGMFIYPGAATPPLTTTTASYTNPSRTLTSSPHLSISPQMTLQQQQQQHAMMLSFAQANGYFFDPNTGTPYLMPHRQSPTSSASSSSKSHSQAHHVPSPSGAPSRELSPSLLPLLSPASLDVIASVRAQIEYYFSDKNLARDSYLRSIMDAEGFVRLDQIARFRRITSLRATAKMMVLAVQHSAFLEVLALQSVADVMNTVTLTFDADGKLLGAASGDQCSASNANAVHSTVEINPKNNDAAVAGAETYCDVDALMEMLRDEDLLATKVRGAIEPLRWVPGGPPSSSSSPPPAPAAPPLSLSIPTQDEHTDNTVGTASTKG